MACAMRHAVIAGRLAFEAGRMGQFLYANASSPALELSGPMMSTSTTLSKHSNRNGDAAAPDVI